MRSTSPISIYSDIHQDSIIYVMRKPMKCAMKKEGLP
ncbi:unnamed protein product [Gongylonema pulchrum]|uniref:Uncharacterized protein n=1 Tax=Gongylonema pulchrum TaxID=637853 RepID=A0A183DJ14_9BILA|nr:unnamed protein product [Gongylonema pulchrum]